MSETNYEQEWYKTYNALCYEVFAKSESGRALLQHLENRHFRSPVAYPNKEPAWAYFNEGKNELIRSFTIAIQQHLAQSNAPKDKPRHLKIKAKQ